MNTELKESINRYRKSFPEISKNKSDIELLLYRGIISKKQADEMSKVPEVQQVKEKKIKKPTIRPYTRNQIVKMCLDASKDFKADNPDIGIDAAAIDLAESMLLFNDRLQEYFKRQGVKKEYWREALADYFV